MLGAFFDALFFGCGSNSSNKALLDKQHEKYLVLDLDETLIHSQSTAFHTENKVIKVK